MTLKTSMIASDIRKFAFIKFMSKSFAHLFLLFKNINEK